MGPAAEGSPGAAAGLFSRPGDLSAVAWDDAFGATTLLHYIRVRPTASCVFHAATTLHRLRPSGRPSAALDL